MRKGTGDFWRFGQGVELVGNRPAGDQGNCRQLSCLKERVTMDDEVGRLCARKQSYVETEREAGPELGEE